MIAINLKGTFNTLREAAQAAARRRPDHQLLVQRQAGLLQPTYGVYAATKAARRGDDRMSWPRSCAAANITVNAVAPGPTATELFLDGKPQEVIEHLAKLAPLERLGQPAGHRRRGRLPRRPGRRAGSTARCCAPMAGSSDPPSRPPATQSQRPSCTMEGFVMSKT